MAVSVCVVLGLCDWDGVELKLGVCVPVALGVCDWEGEPVLLAVWVWVQLVLCDWDGVGLTLGVCDAEGVIERVCDSVSCETVGVKVSSMIEASRR